MSKGDDKRDSLVKFPGAEKNAQDGQPSSRASEPSAAEGLRLMKSFRQIKDPAKRKQIIRAVEETARRGAQTE